MAVYLRRWEQQFAAPGCQQLARAGGARAEEAARGAGGGRRRPIAARLARTGRTGGPPPVTDGVLVCRSGRRI